MDIDCDIREITPSDYSIYVRDIPTTGVKNMD